MRALGVQMDLAPVADLKVKGAYIASLHRAFSARPRPGRDDGARLAARHERLQRRDRAQALARSRIGDATPTTGPASVPPLATLERRDMRPFNTELARGARVVMVGHLTSERPHRAGSAGQRVAARPALPAGQGRPRRGHHHRRAQHGGRLPLARPEPRARGGPGAARRCRLGTGLQRITRCKAIAKIRAAIDSGALPRDQAVASSRRIVALKSSYGLAPR